MSIKRTYSLLPLMAVMLATLWGCGDKHPEYEGAIYSFEEFAFYPDSAFDNKFQIRCYDDGYELTEGDRLVKKAKKSLLPDALSMEGSDRLINQLFNGGMEWTGATAIDDESTLPYRLYVYDVLCNPDSAMEELRQWIEKDKSNAYKPYQWPIMAASVDWALPAREIYFATGDYEWRNSNAADLMAILRRERYLTFDPDMNLFRGATRTAANFRCDSLMNVADVASIYCFSVNADRVTAYDYISLKTGLAAELRDSLAVALETYMWNPRRSSFSEMLYQWPYPIQLDAVDNLAQAAATLAGSVSEAAAERLILNSPVGSMQIYPFYPLSAQSIPSQERIDLTTALWAAAAAKVRNAKAFNRAYSLLARRCISDSSVVNLFRGATLRSLFGIHLTEDYLCFAPFVPQEFGDDHCLKNFRYRDATLDITISGYGDVISTVMLDDELIEDASVPSTIKGHHMLKITLSGFSRTPDGVRVAEPVTLPYTQPASLCADDLHTLWLGKYDRYNIYVDGEQTYQNHGNRFNINPSASRATFYSFVPLADDSVAGMAAPTYSVIPSACLTTINPVKIGQTGTKIFNHIISGNKRNARAVPSADSFVESTRYHNSSLKFTYRAKEEGIYYVQIAYLDGLGIVNPGMRYAFRTLAVDDELRGLFVLPQLPRKSWTPDIKWWEFKGESLPLPVYLSEGVNNMSIDYLTPGATGVATPEEDDANMVIPTAIRIFR